MCSSYSSINLNSFVTSCIAHWAKFVTRLKKYREKRKKQRKWAGLKSRLARILNQKYNNVYASLYPASTVNGTVSMQTINKNGQRKRTESNVDTLFHGLLLYYGFKQKNRLKTQWILINSYSLKKTEVQMHALWNDMSYPNLMRYFHKPLLVFFAIFVFFLYEFYLVVNDRAKLLSNNRASVIVADLIEFVCFQFSNGSFWFNWSEKIKWTLDAIRAILYWLFHQQLI